MMDPILIQNIFENMSAGLIVIDPHGQIVATNKESERILGYAKSDLETRGWGEIFFETEANTDFNQVIIDVIREETLNLHREVSYVTPSGECLNLSITSSFIRNHIEIIGIIVLINDVTEIYQMHQRERRLIEERGQIQKEKAEGLNKFAMSVAHQIRNPISFIGGYAHRILKKIGKDSPYEGYLDGILSGVTRLEEIVKAVGDYTSISQIDPQWVSFSTIIKEVQDEANRRANELSRKIDWHISDDAIHILVDTPLFRKAMGEILFNSLEAFNGNQGSIEIKICQDSDHVVIDVSDNGVGILEKDQPFIFDPFFTTKADSIGIGLSKANRIIVEHMGKIIVKNTSDRGSTVSIMIPDYNGKCPRP